MLLTEIEGGIKTIIDIDLGFCVVCKGTIHSGLRVVPSGNFFFALNRSHHFLLTKSELNNAT